MAGLGIEAAVMNILIGPKLVSDFASTIADDLTKAVKPAAEKAGEEAGKSLSDKITQSMDKVGSTLTKTLTPALAGIGTAAVASFISVDEGLDKVQVNTGATGDALVSLQDSVKTLATTSSSGFGEAADIVSVFYTRLGLAGEPLDTLALQVANLGEITGKAIDPTKIADLFSAFQIPAEKQSETLDKLFAVSQKTGIGFDELTSNVAGNASKFLQLGFSAEEAAVILAQTEKAGFSADTVIAGLTKSIIKSTGSTEDLAKTEGKLADAQQKRAVEVDKLKVAEQKLAELRADPKAKQSAIMAAEATVRAAQSQIDSIDKDIAGFQSNLSDAFQKAGVSGKDAFQSVIIQIQELVAAGDEAGASALAKETFGKGFIEVLQAAKTGAFDFRDLSGEVEGATGTINDLTAATADFPKSLDIARKTTATALEPIGAQVGIIIQQFATQLTPVIEEAGKMFAALPTGAQKFVVILGGLGMALGPTLKSMAALSQVINGFGPMLAKLGPMLAANPWILALAGIAALAFIIYKNWDTISKFLMQIFDALGAAGKAVWEGIKAVAQAVWDAIVGIVQTAVDIVMGIVGMIATIGTAIWDGIKAGAQAAWDAIVGIVQFAVDAIVGIFNAIVGIGSAIWQGLVDGTKAAFDFVLDLIAGYIDLWRNIFSTAGDIAKAVWDGIKAGASAAFGFIGDRIRDAINIWRGIFSTLIDFTKTIWDGIQTAASRVFGAVAGIIRGAISGYINTWKTLFDFIGRGWDAIKRGVQAVGTFITGIFQNVAKIITGLLDPRRLLGALGSALSKIPGVGNILGFRAEGGPVQGGKPYVVGERGPEIMVPRTAGTVIPNSQIAGAMGGETNYQITIVNPSQEPASTSIPNALRKAAYLR